ncbi:unnamed protein product [Effrenium voratum]|nr:unnamed protein product [Effrenium voratum]
MADEGTMQKELQQLRDTLRSDLQKMLDDQTRFLERLVGEGKPKAQAGVAPPEPAKMSPKLKNNKDSLHLPNAVPKERRDSTESNLEDEMLMDPVMPQGPQKRAKDGWGSEEETEPMAVQTARGGRKSFFQRMHSSLLTHGQEEDDQGALKRMKRGPFYAGEDQDSVILDEEVYDVTNFYKEKGCAQALARSDRFERLTLFVICCSAKGRLGRQGEAGRRGTHAFRIDRGITCCVQNLGLSPLVCARRRAWGMDAVSLAEV